MKTTISQRMEKIRLILKSFEPEGMELKFRSIEQPLLVRFDNAKEALINNMNQKIRDMRQIIQNCTAIIESSSPQLIFERGYSMVRVKESGEILRSTAQISEGKQIEIVPAKGKITATVDKIE